MRLQTLECQDVEFERPTDVILWASRTYLLAVSREESIPEVLPATFEEAQLSYLYGALVRVLKCLVASTTVTLTVHEAGCPCTTFYEQALITALRSLQNGKPDEYRIAMTAILPPTAVRLAHTDMSIIASALSDIERFWPAAAPTESTQSETGPTVPYSRSVH